jgi:hypothetical protein
MITCSSTDRKAWTYVEILMMGLRVCQNVVSREKEFQTIQFWLL